MADFDPTKLNSAEENNDPSIIGAVAAGIATGLIRIPEGAASLFASIYDITNDTDTAQGVEEWFDKNIYNKLGDIDEKAEATTAGRGPNPGKWTGTQLQAELLQAQAELRPVPRLRLPELLLQARPLRLQR